MKILQRSSQPQRQETDASVHEPSATQQSEDRGQSCGSLGSAQLALKDVTESSRRSTCHLTANKREKIRQGKRVQKPKAGPTLSKHITFKRMAQSTRSRGQKTTNGQRAEVKLHGDGFYEVAVQYGLCKDLGSGCGFKTGEVMQALNEDNQSRKDTMGRAHEGLEDMDLTGSFLSDQERLDLSVDSEEDLESGGELE